MKMTAIRKIRPARPLNDYERRLLERLFSIRFPGRDQLVQQLGWTRVSAESTGAGLITFAVPSSTERARVTRRIRVEAEGLDRDGTVIHFLLHVVRGRLRELEIFREDGEPLLALPSPESLQVLSLDAEDPNPWSVQ